MQYRSVSEKRASDCAVGARIGDSTANAWVIRRRDKQVAPNRFTPPLGVRGQGTATKPTLCGKATFVEVPVQQDELTTPTLV